MAGRSGEILRLTRYPVGEDSEILFTHSQQMSLSDLVTGSHLLNFDFGFVSFDCGRNEPVKVFDVRGVDSPVMIKLPGIESEMSMEISPGGAFVYGCSCKNCYLWKRNAEEPSSYEVIYHDGTATSPFDRHLIFSFDNDCKVAVCLNRNDKYSHVIDLDTGISKVVHFGLALSPIHFVLSTKEFLSLYVVV